MSSAGSTAQLIARPPLAGIPCANARILAVGSTSARPRLLARRVPGHVQPQLAYLAALELEYVSDVLLDLEAAALSAGAQVHEGNDLVAGGDEVLGLRPVQVPRVEPAAQVLAHVAVAARSHRGNHVRRHV